MAPSTRQRLTDRRIKYKKVDSIESSLAAYTSESITSERGPSTIKYLPLSRTQPPRPPFRTTSLPHFKQLRRLALTANPSAPLPHFSISRRDGAFFQWLILAHADKHGLHEFMDPIWDLLLQVSHVEPCIRHAVLAVAALRRNFRYGSSTWDALCSHNQRFLICHYISAIRGLHSHLSGVKGKAHLLLWEISFVASYLFTILQLALKNASGAYYWLKGRYKILKHAFRAFGPEIHGRTLPASMRDVARAFGRLDTRSIRTERLGLRKSGRLW